MGGTVLARGVREDPEETAGRNLRAGRKDGAEGQWVDAHSHAKLQSGGETTSHHSRPGQQFLVRWSHSIRQASWQKGANISWGAASRGHRNVPNRR